jgi:energy-coupling factor transport system ATP-binding protein
MTAIVEARGLGFQYANAPRPTLSDLCFDVDEGELLVIWGPSGGGKSTLLRTMNGLVPHFHGGAFAGSVRIAGIDTRTRQPRDLASVAGMVFQEPETQIVAQTVEDEIVFGLENLGCDRALTRRRLEEMLDALGIAHLRARAPSSLSGGEQQRVELAAVLAMHPRVLLLDEPTSQLDPQAAQDVLAKVLELRDDLGLTVVASEHRLDRLVQHADRMMHVPGDGSVSIAAPRDAMAASAAAPPVSQIGAALGWSPLPLSVAEARTFAGPRREQSAVMDVRAPGETIVRVRDLSVPLGGRDVLRRVTLDLHAGEIVALMGRNGAGKTTLLRALAGLIAQDSAAIAFTRAEMTEERYRHLAFVMQDPASMLYQRTVVREIADVLQGTGRDGSVEDALRTWELDDLAQRDPRDLSVGERQRVALAAMLVGSPQLILLDEPTRGMDARTKERLLDELRQRRDTGASIVIASHDVELAGRCADRVVLLAEGEVIDDGPVRTVLAGSMAFSTQANKLLGGDVLTAADAIAQARAEATR